MKLSDRIQSKRRCPICGRYRYIRVVSVFLGTSLVAEVDWLSAKSAGHIKGLERTVEYECMNEGMV